MNSVVSNIPGRVKKIFVMFLEEIRLLTNNLIAASNCRVSLTKDNNSTFIDDYSGLELNLSTKGRDDVISDLKIALHTWVTEQNLFSVREIVDSDNNVSTAAIVKLNVIVVGVTSSVFAGYRLSDLDFLCELRVMTLYVITSNNVLFKIEFATKYVNNEPKYYAPEEMIKIGPLL
jgi:hypothetical protein